MSPFGDMGIPFLLGISCHLIRLLPTNSATYVLSPSLSPSQPMILQHLSCCLPLILILVIIIGTSVPSWRVGCLTAGASGADFLTSNDPPLHHTVAILPRLSLNNNIPLLKSQFPKSLPLITSSYPCTVFPLLTPVTTALRMPIH